MTSHDYYTYGAADARNMKSAGHLEAQDETLALGKPTKASTAKGFCGYSLTDFIIIAICQGLPMLIFAAVYLLVSFSWHYKYNALDTALVLVMFGIVVFLGYTAAKRMLQTADGATDHFAVWAVTVFIGVVLAFFLGLYLGWRNYTEYMQPYYEMNELNAYKNVDASSMEGKSFMDAGTIEFTSGSRLDLSKSAGFMNLDMYCIAPVISADSPTSYDFWAVGVNCCTGSPNSFTCGDAVKNGINGKLGGATGGLRLMSSSKLPFYKMAVTQAVTRYGIKSDHPIFVHWVEDSSKALADYSAIGWHDFAIALIGFSVVQAVIVCCGAMGVMIVKSKYV